MAQLSDGVVVIRPGATTEVSMKEKKDRIDDAVHPTKAAVEEGVIPAGAGTVPANLYKGLFSRIQRNQ